MRRWYAAAALASLGLTAVVAHAIAVIGQQPMAPSGDDSAGVGASVRLICVILTLTTPVCLPPPLLWLLARDRARRGGAFLATARNAAALQLTGTLLLLLPVTALPHAWTDVTALAVACVAGLAAATVPQRRVATWAAASASAQNQA